LPRKADGEPEVPTKLKPLLTELRNAVTGTSFPKASWYWINTPEYRSKVLGDADSFRVFARITWAKDWFRIDLKDVGKYKITPSTGINDEFGAAIATAYKKAEQYLQRGK
jgi:hypothetical protein